MPEYIYVRARVVRQQEKVLTVRLDDGFADHEVPVHQDFASPVIRGDASFEIARDKLIGTVRQFHAQRRESRWNCPEMVAAAKLVSNALVSYDATLQTANK